MTSLRLLCSLAILATAAAAAPDARSARGAAHAYLTAEFGISASDLREIEQRRSVGRSLPTDDGREIATLGAIRLQVPPGFYVAQLKDVVRFKRAEAVQQIGTFSTPARLSDVEGLSIPRDQIADLQRCRVHDCKLQLSSAAIERFAREVQWGTPGAADRADRVMREVLVDLVNDYRARGAAALMEYHDRRHPVSVAREFEVMAAERPAVLTRFPSLSRHVLNFPASPSPGVDDLIYWSREKMGPAVIITVTHMSYARFETTPVAHAVASKQLYGSQYFDASLGLTLLLPDPETGAAGSYLVYVNRSRLDVLGGMFGALKRSIVRARTRSAVADHLAQVRDMVERRFAAGTTDN